MDNDMEEYCNHPRMIGDFEFWINLVDCNNWFFHGDQKFCRYDIVEVIDYVAYPVKFPVKNPENLFIVAEQYDPPSSCVTVYHVHLSEYRFNEINSKHKGSRIAFTIPITLITTPENKGVEPL